MLQMDVFSAPMTDIGLHTHTHTRPTRAHIVARGVIVTIRICYQTIDIINHPCNMKHANDRIREAFTNMPIMRVVISYFVILSDTLFAVGIFS